VPDAWCSCGFTILPEPRKADAKAYTSDELLEFAEQHHVFDGVIAASDDLGLYKQEPGVELFYGAHVRPGTFEFFGMPALYGRVLQPEDYQPGAPPVFLMPQKT
jgi:hypothetical protein